MPLVTRFGFARVADSGSLFPPSKFNLGTCQLWYCCFETGEHCLARAGLLRDVTWLRVASLQGATFWYRVEISFEFEYVRELVSGHCGPKLLRSPASEQRAVSISVIASLSSVVIDTSPCERYRFCETFFVPPSRAPGSRNCSQTLASAAYSLVTSSAPCCAPTNVHISFTTSGNDIYCWSQQSWQIELIFIAQSCLFYTFISV